MVDVWVKCNLEPWEAWMLLLKTKGGIGDSRTFATEQKTKPYVSLQLVRTKILAVPWVVVSPLAWMNAKL